jgi:hypothetical protein
MGGGNSGGDLDRASFGISAAEHVVLDMNRGGNLRLLPVILTCVAGTKTQMTVLWAL